MRDPHTGIDLNSPFTHQPIVVWTGWATAGELAVLIVFMVVLPWLGGVLG